MTPQAALAHLVGLSESSIHMGLSRVREALARLGHPELRVPAIHIAGTNGKGSTAAMAAACLKVRYRTGLYTSPHLLRLNERFRVGGKEIDELTLGVRVAEVLEVLGERHQLTYFELGTVVAFHHFAEERVDIAVLETGLGGRLDATVVCVPRVTCITPLSLDHQQYLGTTLSAIASEKAGIIKHEVPVISSAQSEEALEIILRIASRHAALLWLERRDFHAHFKDGVLSYEGPQLKLTQLTLPLSGAHQVQNAATALACIEALGLQGFPLHSEEIRIGLAATRWPGRLDYIERCPPMLLDGAHNQAGVEALVSSLDGVASGKDIHLVFAVLADKDFEKMLGALLPQCVSVAFAALSHPRAGDLTSCVAFARTLCSNTSLHDDVASALTAACARASPQGLVLVTGSLVLVGEVYKLLEKLC